MLEIGVAKRWTISKKGSKQAVKSEQKLEKRKAKQNRKKEGRGAERERAAVRREHYKVKDRR